MKNKIIRSTEDVFETLDELFNDSFEYWNTVYQERPEYMSFLTNFPDENLVSYFNSEQLKTSKVLELGCGEGRNAIYMAKQGCDVEAIDISIKAIQLAKDNANKQNVDVRFSCSNVFEMDLQDNSYDMVYDSGLLHHLLPHRRFQYVDLIHRSLKTNGYLGLICFASGFTEVGGPKEISDAEVYRERNIMGGMAYSEEKLKSILTKGFELIELRYMNEHLQNQELFGKSFLWASLWRKK